MDWLQIDVPKTNFVSLYKINQGEDLSSVAPYLFKCDKTVLDFYRTHGRGQSWGIMINSSLSIELLQKHFRQFLMIKNEEGKQLYFRYYDPRVLRVFLPTCNMEQLVMFFGNISSFLIEDENPDFTLIFRLIDNRLEIQKINSHQI